MEFRVSRPGLPRRRLRLVGPSYTLGSGADCSVRLDDSTLRPTHATLSCHSDRVVLRALGAAIPVCGVPVTEAVLRPGDRFQMGAYDFELLATTTPFPSSEQGSIPSVESRPSQAVSPSAPAVSPSAPAVSASVPTDSAVGPGVLALGADVVSPGVDGAAESKIVPRRRRLSFADLSQSPPRSQSPQPGDSQVSQTESTGSPSPVASFASPEPESRRTGDEGADAPRTEPEHPGFPMSGGDGGTEASRALAAHERRWQQRSKRQLERFRAREQRRRAQIEALRAGQESAERRARQAEDAVNGLRGQLTELAGRVSTLSGTVMPGIEGRIDQQHQDVAIQARQTQGLVDSLRSRLDFLQSSIDELQSETRSLRQQTSEHHEEHLETSATADQLERSFQSLSDQYESSRGEFEAKIDEMRGEMHQLALKLAETSTELDETRQSGRSLRGMVQQLRTSLQNVQSDAERFATLEQLAQTQQRLLENQERVVQLAEDYEAHSQQLQLDYESLRQRVEDAEELAQRTAMAAANVLRATTESAIPPAAPAEAPAPADARVDAAAPSPVDAGSPSPVDADVDPDADDHTAVDAGADADALAMTRLSYAAGEVADEEFDEEVENDASALAPQWDDDVEEEASSLRSYDSPFDTGADARDPAESIEALEADDRQSPSGDTSDSGAAWSWRDSMESAEDDFDNGATYQFEMPTDAARMLRDAEEQLSEGWDTPAEQPSFWRGATNELTDPELADSKLADSELDAPELDAPELDEPELDEPHFRSGFDESSSDAMRSGEPESDDFAADSFASDSVAEDAEADEAVDQRTPQPGWADVSAHAIDDSDGDSAVDCRDSHQPTATRPDASAQSSASAASDDDDEDSIEAYMNRLLQRVGGGASDTTASSLSSTSKPPAPTPTATTSTTTASTIPGAVPVEAHDYDSAGAGEASVTTTASLASTAEYLPRSQAPERSSNLAAMRELANSSARTAIAISARRRALNQIVFKFSLFGLGIVAGLAVLAGANFAADKWMLVALCCFGLATFYLYEGISLRKELLEGDTDVPAEPAG